MSRLLIVSNRLPISVTKNKDKLQFEPGTGGLTATSGAFYESQPSLWTVFPACSLKRRSSHLPGIISRLERKS
jgi:trehalose 6-phosphate synthase/phosphatase